MCLLTAKGFYRFMVGIRKSLCKIIFMSPFSYIIGKGVEVLKDRFTRGFLAGVIAGIPVVAFSWVAASLKWTTLRWSDFAAILIYGHKSANLGEEIFSVVGVFVFCGVLGIICAFIIPKISSSNYLLKSWVFSIAVWFAAFVLTLFYKVPGLLIIPLKTVVSNFAEATIWGFMLGYCLKWFDNRLKT
ncbi:MAG TPA: hypothetical protein DDW50_15440 [Firmicutes bacterium]|nr:hypothetical protein [Bacillota bacterium]